MKIRTEDKILVKMLRLAKELSNSNEHLLWELGHYLADNIISKLALMVCKDKEKQGDKINYKNKNGMVKNFKWMYNNILKNYFPDLPSYNELKDKHRDRNIFQHEYDSIHFGIRKEISIDYVIITETIIKKLNIIDQDINPTNYLSSKTNHRNGRKSQSKHDLFISMDMFFKSKLFEKGNKILSKLLEKEPENYRLRLYLAVSNFEKICEYKTEKSINNAYRTFFDTFFDYYENYLLELSKLGKFEEIESDLFTLIHISTSILLKANEMQYKKLTKGINMALLFFLNAYLETNPANTSSLLDKFTKKFENKLDKVGLMILDHFYSIFYFLMEDYTNSKYYLIQQLSKSIDWKNDNGYDIVDKINRDEFDFFDIGIHAFILIIINHLFFPEKQDIEILKKIKGAYDIILIKKNHFLHKFDIDNHFLENLKDIIKSFDMLQRKFNLISINLKKLSNLVQAFYNYKFKEKNKDEYNFTF